MTASTEEREAFTAYLSDCGAHAIVPDLAGAFAWAWRKPVEAAVKQAREDALEKAQADMSEALMRDCEHGIKWVNEKAAADFKAVYPNVYAAIESLKGKP